MLDKFVSLLIRVMRFAIRAVGSRSMRLWFAGVARPIRESSLSTIPLRPRSLEMPTSFSSLNSFECQRQHFFEYLCLCCFRLLPRRCNPTDPLNRRHLFCLSRAASVPMMTPNQSHGALVFSALALARSLGF